APRVAPCPVRVRGVLDRSVVHCVADCEPGPLMSTAEQRPEKSRSDAPAEVTPRKVAAPAAHRRVRILPFVATAVTVAVAAVLSWLMWESYMGTPWTRDGRVRVYVVTIAPQVAGTITQLPVKDDQFVHKDDLLMEIDPTNYK